MQMMLFVKRLIESLKLRVKVPMIIETDNKGVVDLVNGWSIDGNIKHIETRVYFLRELKEAGTLKVKWISRNDNEPDIFVKNVTRPEYRKHVSKFMG